MGEVMDQIEFGDFQIGLMAYVGIVWESVADVLPNSPPENPNKERTPGQTVVQGSFGFWRLTPGLFPPVGYGDNQIPSINRRGDGECA